VACPPEKAESREENIYTEHSQTDDMYDLSYPSMVPTTPILGEDRRRRIEDETRRHVYVGVYVYVMYACTRGGRGKNWQRRPHDVCRIAQISEQRLNLSRS